MDDGCEDKGSGLPPRSHGVLRERSNMPDYNQSICCEYIEKDFGANAYIRDRSLAPIIFYKLIGWLGMNNAYMVRGEVSRYCVFIMAINK
jgi:hypothetical protein